MSGTSRAGLTVLAGLAGAVAWLLVDAMELQAQAYLVRDINPGSHRSLTDLDGDGRSDILWRHTSGALYVWQMNGTGLLTSGYLSPIDLSWEIQGIGDFNGDGTADILWRHSSGATYLWFMSGSTLAGSGYTDAQTDSSWQIQGTGDFNGDGKADILWRHTSGALYVWLMDGTKSRDSAYLSPIDLGWQIKGLGDLDGDGHADVVWRQASTGATYVWFMSGSSVIGQGYTGGQPDNTWQIQGVADLSGDGRDDVLWRHTGGALYVWVMEGLNLASGTTYLPPISLAWQVKALGDYDADGRADLLWRSTDGSTYLWLMNGATVVGQGYAASQADNSWTIQAPSPPSRARFLSLVEGDPGVPGDGKTVRTSLGEFAAPFVGVANGITVSAFLVPGQVIDDPTVGVAAVKFIGIACGGACVPWSCCWDMGAPRTSNRPSFNGTTGIANSRSRADLQQAFDTVKTMRSACTTLTLDDCSLRSFGAVRYQSPTDTFGTPILEFDAVAVGAGENIFP